MIRVCWDTNVLIARCVRRGGATMLLTWNVRHFSGFEAKSG